MLTRLVSGTSLFLMFIGCTPDRRGGPEVDEPPMTVADLASPAPDLARPPVPDLGYICGQYYAYTAQTSGIVRSPCDYDVSKLLAIGGDVKTKINPPTISMEFPDGTFFSGTTDGKTFTATRLTDFPFTDGCNWQATETLSGTVDAAQNCTLNGTYSYREAPVSPPPCAEPCTIDAQVVISRVAIIIG